MSSDSTTSIDGAAAARVEEFAESLAAARVVRTVGKVSVVVIEAGREQVSLRTDCGRDVSFAASAPLVEQAGALLGQPVVVTSLASSQSDAPARLLRLDTLDADVAGDAEERLASLAAQWSVALEALSK
jgi:hypothetical protein